MAATQYFEHPHALVETKKIGAGTRVWAFAHILPGARIGADCNLCDHTFIENDVVLGDRVTVKCGVQIWDGCRVEDDVFIGPNVTFTNDPEPRSKRHLESYPETRVCRGASIGANATILPGITIGRQSVVGAGAVVTRSVPPYAVVMGNPARIVRYVDDASRQEAPESVQIDAASGSVSVHVEGVSPSLCPDDQRSPRESLGERAWGWLAVYPTTVFRGVRCSESARAWRACAPRVRTALDLFARHDGLCRR